MEDNINKKQCGRCKNIKEFSEFNKCKSQKLGLHSHCRQCQKEVKAEWDNKNRDWIKEYSNSPEVKERSNKFYQEKYKNNDDYKTNKNRARKERYANDEKYREKMLERNRIRRRQEPAKIKQRANEKLRRQLNPSYRIRANLNTRLKFVLKNMYINKSNSIIELIGCSMEDLIKYIESKFLPGMTWDNYGQGEGKWHVDHIIPCCSFDLTKIEEQKKCYNYTNLQPLWGIDNLKKGAKLENGEDARVFNQTKNYKKLP